MSWRLDERPIRSVLVTRLRYLGDIVMSTVVVEALRRGDPSLEVGFLCEDGFAPVLEDHPGLDRLHRLGSGRRGADAEARIRESSSGGSRGTPGMIRELRRARYDLAVDLFFNPRSAWLLRLSGIPRRIGGTEKSRGRLYTHRALRRDLAGNGSAFGRLAPGGLGEHLCRLGPLVHEETGLGFADWVVDSFGREGLKPRLDRDRRLRKHPESLTELGIGPGDSYLLLAPCATWPSKEWPSARWEELIPLLLESTDLPLAVLVSPGRQADWSEPGGGIPPGRGGVLPVMSLPGALDVTAGATALVTVDGGIMHAGIGYDVPTVAIFGPTDPAIWFPYENLGPFRVLARAPHCHPCDLHECPAFICLPELEPGRVRDALADLLESVSGAEGGRT